MEHTSRHRDRHLERVSRITRWLVVAAAGGTGLFAFLLARPQTSVAKATTTKTGGAPSATAAGSGAVASSSKSSTKLKAPAQAPQRSSAAPRVSSGGS